MAKSTVLTVDRIVREFHLRRRPRANPEHWLIQSIEAAVACRDDTAAFMATIERLNADERAMERAGLLCQLHESKRRIGLIAEARAREQSLCDAEIGEIDAAIAFLEVQ